MTGIAALQVATLEVGVLCCRCHKPQQLQVSGLAPSLAEQRAWCACGAILSCAIRPSLVHAENGVLCHLDLGKCCVTDVLGGALLLACSACGGEAKSKPWVRKQVNDSRCFACHAALSFA